MVTHVVFDMDDVLAVRDTEATCASLASAAGLSSDVVMQRYGWRSPTLLQADPPI